MNFNIFKSKTVLGAIVALGSALIACDWSKGIPWTCVGAAAGTFIAVIGVRDAIAGNGASTVTADKQNG